MPQVPCQRPCPKAPAPSKHPALTHLFLCPLDFAPPIPLLRHIRVGILVMQLILVLTRG